MWRALLSIVEYTRFKMDDEHQNVRVITAESDSKFVLGSCCCCIPLRTGCLIIGYLQLVDLILTGLFSIIAIRTSVELLHANSADEEQKIKETVIIAATAALLVFIIISLPFTILLLVGLHKERPNYVNIYLVFMVVSLVLRSSFATIRLSAGYSLGTELPSAIIYILLTYYIFLVLRSQYIKMGFTNNVPTQNYRDGQLMNRTDDRVTSVV